MTHHLKSTVVWELLDEPHPGQDNRIVVEVDAPLRPFGGPPAPAKSGSDSSTTRPPAPVSAEMEWALLDEPGRQSGKLRRLPRIGT